jgi:glycosyltransferase involved in cell wall biosynthesis
MELKISIIVPVFNRPGEVDELLASLASQSYQDFEIILVEDGSTTTCKEVASRYSQELSVSYFYKDNSGPGPSRNFGGAQAKGNYFIFFDSDVIVPPGYLEIVMSELEFEYTDAFGGPDKAHESFTPLQKAINYSMTSFLTTGGIRGSKKAVDTFHPRSFNMGISKKVFQELNGFSAMRFGEDVDFSLRIIESGFKTRLIPNAFVYHKRRNTLRSFFKQVNNSGIARINLYRLHPASLKAVHFLPAVFTLGLIILLAAGVVFPMLLNLIGMMILIILIDSSVKNRSVKVGALSIITTIVQLTGYGLGFIKAFWKRIILKQDSFVHFRHNFYK